MLRRISSEPAVLLVLARDRDRFLDKEPRPEGLYGVDAPLLASLRESITTEGRTDYKAQVVLNLQLRGV